MNAGVTSGFYVKDARRSQRRRSIPTLHLGIMNCRAIERPAGKTNTTRAAC
jgi:hypothetical protein